MCGLCPGMEWGCGGTERERSDRDATHALHPLQSYQGLEHLRFALARTKGYNRASPEES